MPPEILGLIKVKYEREFILPIAGLSLGSKHYAFELRRNFFDLVGYDECSDALVNVSLVLEKHENMIELHFDIQGWIELPCDRCADEYKQPVKGTQNLILKLGTVYEEESDEVITIPVEQHQFDVRHLIYEYIILLLPIRKIHPDDEQGNSSCNSDVISKLDQIRVETEVDPRWDALSKLNSQS